MRGYDEMKLSDGVFTIWNTSMLLGVYTWHLGTLWPVLAVMAGWVYSPLSAHWRRCQEDSDEGIRTTRWSSVMVSSWSGLLRCCYRCVHVALGHTLACISCHGGMGSPLGAHWRRCQEDSDLPEDFVKYL